MEKLSITVFRSSTVKYTGFVSLIGVWLVGFAALAAAIHFSNYHFALAKILWPSVFVQCGAMGFFFRNESALETSTALRVLSRGLTVTCFVYILLQWPDVPVIPQTTVLYYPLLYVSWGLTLVCTVLAWWRPIMLIVPGVWLPWVKALTGHVTGFEYHNALDILPMFQLSLGVGLAFAVITIVKTTSRFRPPDNKSIKLWATCIAFILISFHLTGYAMSAYEKVTLDGGVFSWLVHNNIRNIFFAGITFEHLFWMDIGGAIEFVTKLFGLFGRPGAIAVLLMQAAAVTAFASRKYAIFLVLLFDVFHIGIFLIQGANFFSWILVNLAITACIVVLPKKFFGFRPMLIAFALMIFCQLLFSKFYRVPALGWYDTLAVNDAHFVAYTDDGEERRVPNAFFGLYSYPISHMSFGYPEEGQYFPTGTNGGTDFFSVTQQANDCSFDDASLENTERKVWNRVAVEAFIRSRHQQMLNRHSGALPWSANIYWHHFWNPPSSFNRFREIRLDEIAGYRFVVSSYCITPTEVGPEHDLQFRNSVNIPIS